MIRFSSRNVANTAGQPWLLTCWAFILDVDSFFDVWTFSDKSKAGSGTFGVLRLVGQFVVDTNGDQSRITPTDIYPERLQSHCLVLVLA